MFKISLIFFMYSYQASFFNLCGRYDLLKKSYSKTVQKLIYVNKKKFLISDIKVKKFNSYSKLKTFWCLEISTLQKAFFQYKIKHSRKIFYVSKLINVLLTKKRTQIFFHNFLKTSLSLIPFLNYFFIATHARNLKVETGSIFEAFKNNGRIFSLLTDWSFSILQLKSLEMTLWLSLYKIVL